MRRLINVFSLSKALSNYPSFDFLRVLFLLAYFVVTRKYMGFKKDFQLRCLMNNVTQTLHLRYPMDTVVLREIFVDKEYEWVGDTTPTIIIDLGAHFGDTALYYHSRFPSARIYAVEPSPENYERLLLNTKGIQNIVPINACVGKEDGKVTLHLLPSSLGHSVIKRNKTGDEVVVKQITLQTLFTENNITKADVIKFDIEGAEFDLFASIDPASFSNAYIGEIHYDLQKSGDEDIVSRFNAFKVKIEKLNSQRSILQAQTSILRTTSSS